MEATSLQPDVTSVAKSRKPRALTKRQLRFIASYLSCLNASKAAREAGYSERTSYSIGHENRHKPAIKAIIDAELDRQHKEWEAEFRLKQQQQANRFARR